MKWKENLVILSVIIAFLILLFGNNWIVRIYYSLNGSEPEVEIEDRDKGDNLIDGETIHIDGILAHQDTVTFTNEIKASIPVSLSKR